MSQKILSPTPKEWILHVVWYRQLYSSLSFFNFGNYAPVKFIEVLYPGVPNNDAGPDFLNAKIRINSVVWVGNVEIHRKSSDWYLHKHNQDPTYNTTILHVILEDDCDVFLEKSQDPLFSCLMHIDDKMLASIREKGCKDLSMMRCFNSLKNINLDKWEDWKDKLFEERVRQKEDHIASIYYSKGEDIAETLHILLLRYWGSKVNNEAFQQLAQSLPIRVIRKHTDQLPLLEALYLGQASLLEEVPKDSYQEKLQEDYKFLQMKYGLKPLPKGMIKMLRLRPSAFPHRRLAQMAALRYKYPLLESEILNLSSLKQAQALFHTEPSEYWLKHYHFAKLVDKKIGVLSRQTIESIFINVILPYKLFLSTLGYYKFSIEEVKKALKKMKAEDNKMIRSYITSGIVVRNAYDSQALLQLAQEYSVNQDCFRSYVGEELFSK